MIVTTDLYHVANVEKHDAKLEYTEHRWKIFVTDILEADRDRHDCNVLQIVFDPEDRGKGKAIGDVDDRLGKVKVAMDHNKRQFKSSYRDEQLVIHPGDLTGPKRRLYLVVFEKKDEESFLACARIRYETPINSR